MALKTWAITSSVFPLPTSSQPHNAILRVPEYRPVTVVHALRPVYLLGGGTLPSKPLPPSVSPAKKSFPASAEPKMGHPREIRSYLEHSMGDGLAGVLGKECFFLVGLRHL